MLRSVLRASVILASGCAAVVALASPSGADHVAPDGCVGSIAYVCTDHGSPVDSETKARVPVDVWYGSSPVPQMTLGGQPVGGIGVLVPGATLPGISTQVGGPTDPIDTGVETPVNVCAFVTCFPAGTPVAVPGIPVPVVPVDVPPTHVPALPVVVPVIATLPTQTTPGLATPYVSAHVVVVTVHTRAQDVYNLALAVCEAGGGALGGGGGSSVFGCQGGVTYPASNVLFMLYDQFVYGPL